ncbi:MAG: preprotein translocase subunit SecE [Gammaproteobacteria bacterium]|nr:preprotein translocase subunit SecE [Gammaproteobacteria bacterium]
MNSKAGIQGSGKADTFKLTTALVLLAGAVVAFYYYSEQILLVRVLGLLAVAGIAVALASQTDKGRRIWIFATEARVEVRKVVWPTRQETVQTTLVVLLLVILVSILVWFMDMLFLWAIQLLTGQG